MTRSSPARKNETFRLLYSLAFLGAHLAFMPLLLLLLPRRVETLVRDQPTSALSMLLIVGAFTASVAHVVAGHASDRWLARHGDRRVPIAVGLSLLMASYAGLAAASSLALLALALVAFQAALNIMFAPLGALLADHVDDRNKARTAAWLTLSLPLSIAISGPIATLFPQDGSAAFAAVALLIALCIVPLLVLWPVTVQPAPAGDDPRHAASTPLPLADFRRAWIARFLVQCGAALIIFYLYVYLRQLPPSAGVPDPLSRALSTLVSVGGVAGAAAAFLMGQLSDRLQQRRWPIATSGVLAAGGLLLLAVQPGWPLIVTGYAIFSAGLIAFLSTDSAMIAQMLGNHPSRGRWLGIMNLTNTIPAIVTPTLTLLALQIASGSAIRFLLVSAAMGALLAAHLIIRVSSIR